MDKDPLTMHPVYRTMIARMAAEERADVPFLVAHYLRDNPFPASLRGNAAWKAKVARSNSYSRTVRRRAAVSAMAMLRAASVLQPVTAKRLP